MLSSIHTLGRTLGTKTLSLSLAAALVAAALPGALHGAAPVRADAATVNCDVPDGQLAIDGEEQAMLDMLNAYRAQNGLGPVQFDEALQRAAAWKAVDMASNRYTAHDDSFRTWDQRFRDCGYTAPYAFMAENLAGGFPTGAQTLNQWQNSPVHNENLLDGHMNFIGIVRYHSPNANDPYGWYWVMELGSDA
ncbi:MAG TPA: CAP domain-containing protein [Dehalococcoidia bacterium]|nr:CAP domain-containing protein [Dehalococcoidia bacterium]